MRNRHSGNSALRFWLGAGVASTALLTGIGYAAAQDSVALDEISVSAAQPTAGTRGIVATRSTAGMKGNTSILETPGTVSVITRQEMEVRGVQNIEQAVAYTPGLLAVDYAGAQGGPAFNVRGFRNINYENVYEDGLRYGFNAYDQLIEPYGYERIDVLKGPQSALYGQGQPGGLINLISKRPQFTRYNEVFLMGGSYNRIQGGFDLTGPVEGHPEFAYRITGLIRTSDTQVKFSPDDRIYIAPAVTWRPDSDTSLTVMGKYQNTTRGGSEQVLPYIGSVIPNPTMGFFKRDLFIGSPNFNRETMDNRSVSYILDHSFAPNWLFHSAFRYLETDSQFKLTGFGGYDPVNFPPNLIFNYPYMRDQTQNAMLADNHVEGRFDTGPIQHNIVAGVDFQNTVRRNHQFLGPNAVFDVFAPTYNTNVNPNTFTDYLHARQSGQQTGIYLQDQMKVGSFILTGSVRHDWVESKLLSDTNYITPTPGIRLVTNQRTSETALTYRGAIGYELGHGLVPYVAYSTGFNPQISGFSIGTGGAIKPLDPTESRQIETGLKWQPVGSNALYTISGYEIKQSNVPFPDPLNFGAFLQTGEVTSTGFELEGKQTFDNGISIVGGYAFTDAIITKDTTVNPLTGQSRVGERAQNIPRHSFSLFVDYAVPEEYALAGFRIGAGVRYVGQRTGIIEFDRLPGYALVDGSISYDLARLGPTWKGFTLSAYGTNLFDKRYFNSAFYPVTVFEGYRRTVYGQLTYRW